MLRFMKDTEGYWNKTRNSRKSLRMNISEGEMSRKIRKQSKTNKQKSSAQ